VSKRNPEFPLAAVPLERDRAPDDPDEAPADAIDTVPVEPLALEPEMTATDPPS